MSLNTLTAQEVYDIVKSHLLEQGRQSKTFARGSPNCAYKGGSGTSCAVGCLIPDDVYDLSMEGNSVCGLLDLQIDSALEQFLKKHLKLLYNLQGVHDSYFPQEWPEQLVRVATEHKLIP